MESLRFVSERGTVAVFAASERDRAHTAHKARAVWHNIRHGIPSTAKRMNRVLQTTHEFELDNCEYRGSSLPSPRCRHRVCCSACPDRPGLIAAVSGFLADAQLNIVDADQRSSNEGRFFMRMVFDAGPRGRAGRAATTLRARRSRRRFEMDYRFAESSERKRVAIMVSREDHCLSDLLWRWRSGELGAEVVAVISNHPDHAEQVAVARPALPPRAGPPAGDRAPGGGAPAGGARPARSTWSCWPATCRSSRADSSHRIGCPVDQHPPLVTAGLRRRGARTGTHLSAASK